MRNRPTRSAQYTIIWRGEIRLLAYSIQASKSWFSGGGAAGSAGRTSRMSDQTIQSAIASTIAATTRIQKPA